MLSKLLLIISCSAAFVCSAQKLPDNVSFVGNFDSKVRLSENDIISIFNGTKQFIKLSSGRTVRINVVLPSEKNIGAETFAKIIFDESKNYTQRHWLRLVFSGRAASPVYSYSNDETISIVSRNSNSIGFINDTSYSGKLKIDLK